MIEIHWTFKIIFSTFLASLTFAPVGKTRAELSDPAGNSAVNLWPPSSDILNPHHTPPPFGLCFWRRGVSIMWVWPKHGSSNRSAFMDLKNGRYLLDIVKSFNKHLLDSLTDWCLWTMPDFFNGQFACVWQQNKTNIKRILSFHAFIGSLIYHRFEAKYNYRFKWVPKKAKSLFDLYLYSFNGGPPKMVE